MPVTVPVLPVLPMEEEDCSGVFVKEEMAVVVAVAAAFVAVLVFDFL